MKINKATISKAIENLSKTTTNKFWGALAVIGSINEPIEPNKTYSVESSSIMKFLDELFNLKEFHNTEYGHSIIYVKFSAVWKERLFSLTLKGKPNLTDAAIFFNKFNHYGEDINSTTLKDKFLNDCKITLNGLQGLFVEGENKNITLEDYNLDSLVEDFTKFLNVERKPNYHLSLESPFFILSRPSELKRAPFIQTLYSGDRIKELMLLSDINLEELYPTDIGVKEIITNLEVTELMGFYDNSKHAKLKYDRALVIRFIASLLTKPFVILTGLSGSGKTKLAQAFAQWITADKSQYAIVPVGADWTNREPLVGYPNGLKAEEYITPDSGVIHLLMEALKKENENKPFFLILDEMNLSHVERYFADFLSIMESNDSIKLYTGKERSSLDGIQIPFEIGWPKNVFIIGTVNIDETTYMFSPKVLDRANVIEFRISEDEIQSFLGNPGVPDLMKLTKQGVAMAESFLLMASLKNIEKNDNIATELVSFFNQLQPVGAEFGYRSATEIMQLAAKLKMLEPSITDNECLDIAIMQKLLPKLHGSRSKLVKILIALAGLCVEGITKEEFEKKFEEFYKNGFDGLTVKYPISFEKLIRMYKNVLANGFTSYAEA